MPRLRPITKDSFTQNLAQGRIVVPYLEGYDDLDRDWEFRYTPKLGDDAWHPSGDCVPPVSALYAKATGEAKREKHSPGTQRNFMVGHFWHALIQDILVRLEFCTPDDVERRGHRWWGEKVCPKSDMTLNHWGVPRWDDTEADIPGYYRKEDLYYIRYPESQIRDESGRVVGHDEGFIQMARHWPDDLCGMVKVRPQPYHWTTGSGDIAPLVMPNWRGVFDIKTMAGAMWKQSWKSGLLPPAFADKYECQVNVYMDFFNEDRALILGVNKDAPHGFVEFEFERNQDLIDTIYAKWEYVSFCLDEGIEPDSNSDDEFPLPLTGPIS